MNFTWGYSYPNHLISEIHFGIYRLDWETIDPTLIWISRHKNGTVRVNYGDKSQDTAPYAGRLRWTGDLSQNRAAFELSGLSSADKKHYGIEVSVLDYLSLR